ncbi:hypothetical protein SDC9_110286 [bioreactor metagenome]|uniref:Uncharacterized protein n=1 Tax=bioreactor metagenome TaxID=1076179 RepID=A0A645BE67_9ZZZZ
MRRVNYPHMHLFVIGSGNPALFYFSHFKLIENFLIFKRNFLFFTGFGINHINLVRFAHRTFHSYEFFTCRNYRQIIMYTLRNRGNTVCNNIRPINLSYRMPYTYKINRSTVVRPCQRFRILIECGRQIFFLTGCHIHHKQTVLIRLITITLLTFPSQPFAIRRKNRVEVIAQHSFCLICCFTCTQIVKIDIRIGRNRILFSCFFAGSISDDLSIRTPCQLLNAS